MKFGVHTLEAGEQAFTLRLVGEGQKPVNVRLGRLELVPQTTN